MKKLFAALLAVLCLSGCGAKEQPQPAEAQSAPVVEEPTPAEPAPETPEVVEIPMETLPEETPVEGLSIPDYETVSLEGLVEDAIGYVIDYPVFSGFDGAETVNGFYLNLAEHLERYTKETVYKDIAKLRKAEVKGCAPSRISQIHTSAISKLRGYFNLCGLEEY